MGAVARATRVVWAAGVNKVTPYVLVLCLPRAVPGAVLRLLNAGPEFCHNWFPALLAFPFFVVSEQRACKTD